MREGPAAQRDVLVDKVWQRLRELTDRETYLSLQWVAVHAGLPGNETADKVARGCRPESTRSSREPPVSKGQAAEARPRGMGGAHPVDQLSGSRPATSNPGGQARPLTPIQR